jgi:hypothetical protein
VLSVGDEDVGQFEVVAGEFEEDAFLFPRIR